MCVSSEGSVFGAPEDLGAWMTGDLCSLLVDMCMLSFLRLTEVSHHLADGQIYKGLSTCALLKNFQQAGGRGRLGDEIVKKLGWPCTHSYI